MSDDVNEEGFLNIRPRNPRPEFLGPIGAWEPGPESYAEEDREREAAALHATRQQTLADQLGMDLLLYGNAYVVDGKRVDPTTVVVHRRTPQGEAEQLPSVQEEGWTAQVIKGLMPTPEQYAERAQQLRNEQYAKAGLPMPGDAAKGALAYLLSLPGSPSAVIHTQEEFLTALDILLDHTLHADECYIDDAQTECVCVIGKVRAVLPPCGATYRPAHPQRGDRIVTCHRNAHPASPDRHVF